MDVFVLPFTAFIAPCTKENNNNNNNKTHAHTLRENNETLTWQQAVKICDCK